MEKIWVGRYSLTVAFYYGADEVGNIIFEDDDKFTTESVLMLNQGIPEFG